MSEISTVLGSVRMRYKGPHNPATEYSFNDLVSANGGSYAYINPTPAAGVPLTDTSHWQQIASVGGQDLVNAAVAARDAAQGQAALAQGYAAQLAAGVTSPVGPPYANLTALNNANPDHSKIYITLDDGKWCYHNGAAFVSGGVYQAAAVADNSITPSMMKDSERYGNLLETSVKTVVGKYARNYEGVLSEISSANFTYNIFPVEPNTDYVCTYSRFTTLLSRDKTTVISEIERGHQFFSGSAEFVAISYNFTTYPTATWSFCKGLKLYPDGQTRIPWLYVGETNKPSENIVSISMAAMAPSDWLNLGNYDVKSNQLITFYARVTSFVSMWVGHGFSSYNGSYVTIDNTNITAYNFVLSTEQSAQEAHGLTIGDFIGITIHEVNDVANITVTTSSGSYTLSEVPWAGENGPISAYAENATLTDCSIKWTSPDLLKDIYVFGDSYLSFKSVYRYPYYLRQMGLDNFLACGYPGATSRAQLSMVKKLLKLRLPKMLVWCLGINNPDSGSVNSEWLSDAQNVLSVCDYYEIVPVLATIPSTPTMDNSYKNAWVRASGRRIIDFEKAVGADISTSWYTGMLSGDNVHPTELGAKALAARFIADVPEACT